MLAIITGQYATEAVAPKSMWVKRHADPHAFAEARECYGQAAFNKQEECGICCRPGH